MFCPVDSVNVKKKRRKKRDCPSVAGPCPTVIHQPVHCVVKWTSPYSTLHTTNQSSLLAAVRQKLIGDEGDLVLWQQLVKKKVWQIIPKGSITCS